MQTTGPYLRTCEHEHVIQTGTHAAHGGQSEALERQRASFLVEAHLASDIRAAHIQRIGRRQTRKAKARRRTHNPVRERDARRAPYARASLTQLPPRVVTRQVRRLCLCHHRMRDGRSRQCASRRHIDPAPLRDERTPPSS